MKVKNITLFFITCGVLIIAGFDCYAQSYTSPDLINNAKQYDKKTVSYQGEAIGEIMVRGDRAWVHVNDGIIAIGIWAPKTMTDNIRYIGNYAQTGDIVEVVGTFHRACLEHGGDLDIHASEIRKITSGRSISQPVSRKKIRIGAYSLMFVMLFIALERLPQKIRGRFRTS
jgi:hypothetical protein